MRTHRQIVQAHGASALFRDLGALGVKLHQTTPQRWADRDSIPGEYWTSVSAVTGASLEELAEAAESRRASKADASEAAA